MADLKVENYPIRATEPKDTDLIDVTIEDTPGGGIWASEKMEYQLIKHPIATGATTLIVAIDDGDDSTAIKGRVDKPYATIAGANADVVTGDTVVVYGNVVERAWQKTGVNYVINGNVIYSGVVDGGIIDDSAGPLVCKIFINGNISNSGTATAPFVVLLSDSGSVIDMTFNEMSMTDVTGAYAVDVAGGATATLRGDIPNIVFAHTAGKLTIHGNCYNVIAETFNAAYDDDTLLEIYGHISQTNFNGGIAMDVRGGATFIGHGDVVTNIGDESIQVVNHTGIIKVFGKVHQTGGDPTSGAVVITSSTGRIDLFGGVESATGQGVKLTNATTGVHLYGTIESKRNDSIGDAIVLNNVGLNEVVLHNCTLVCFHADALSIRNSGGVTKNQTAIIYNSVANRIADPLVIQEVSNINFDINVK